MRIDVRKQDSEFMETFEIDAIHTHIPYTHVFVFPCHFTVALLAIFHNSYTYANGAHMHMCSLHQKMQ